MVTRQFYKFTALIFNTDNSLLISTVFYRTLQCKMTTRRFNFINSRCDIYRSFNRRGAIFEFSPFIFQQTISIKIFTLFHPSNFKTLCSQKKKILQNCCVMFNIISVYYTFYLMKVKLVEILSAIYKFTK